MPNHCSNNLTMLNGGYILPLIEEYMKGENLNFNKIIPFPTGIDLSHSLSSEEIIKSTWHLPDSLKKSFEDFTKQLEEYNQKTYEVDGWYDWCVENWGTKWNSYDGFIKSDEKGDAIFFVTAWSPPCQVILKLAELIDAPLRLTYLEEGMMFCGEYIAYPDGNYIDNCYDDIVNVPDNLKEELGLNEEDEDEE